MSPSDPRPGGDRPLRPSPIGGQSFWAEALADVGRTFFRILGLAGVGLTGGLAYGAFLAHEATTVGPKAPKGSWADLETVVIWLISLVVYGMIGFVIGLAGGLLAVLFWSLARLVRGRKASPQDFRPAPRVVDFAEIPGVPCPCGTARRAFADAPGFPSTIHVTEVSEDAKLHHHRTLTETYYVLECGDDARIQLDDDVVPVRPGVCVMIPPGVRHRAIGRMKVLIVVVPKFDPADEFLDEA